MSKYFSLGLVGYPLSHSFSPAMYLAALEAVGLHWRIPVSTR